MTSQLGLAGRPAGSTTQSYTTKLGLPARLAVCYPVYLQRCSAQALWLASATRETGEKLGGIRNVEA